MKTFPFVLLTLWPLVSFAQCDPGPPIGGGVNRCYEDGYVYVDCTGNSGGVTGYWGYQSGSQIQGGSIVFHSMSYLDATTLQVLTDTYDLGGIVPPLPPYTGVFCGGFVPVISDAPVSRSVLSIIIPPLLIRLTPTNSVIVSWPSSATGWTLQEKSDLNTTNWVETPTPPSDDGTTKSVVVPPVRSRFYRLVKPAF